MSIYYHSQRRFTLSIATAVVLGGLFWGFRAVTSPFLDVEHKQRQFTSGSRVEIASSELLEEAEKWFPDHSWVAKSRKHFRADGGYLYCRDFNLTDNDRSVKVEPIAMILYNKPDEHPITIVADSARLDCSGPISQNSFKLGRVVGGVLDGNVRIEGPRGLRIEGRSFQLDESSMKLWSTDEVTFQMDEHRGSARRGVDVYLHGAAGSSGGLTNVTDVRQIRLNGRVFCKFFLPATRVDEEDQELEIRSAGGFSYEVLTRTGTFSGIAPPPRARRLKNPADEVWVKRFAGGVLADQLVCPELMLRFRNPLPSEESLPTGDSMQLEHIKAWGRQVLYKSEVHDVIMNANEFSYALSERRIDIFRHHHGGSGDSSTDVEVNQGDIKLHVPHVRILHTATGGIQRVEFNGKGWVRGHSQQPQHQEGHPTKPSNAGDPGLVFGATWLKSLTMQVAPDQVTRVVSLEGGASVSEASRDFHLEARTIKMKLTQTTPAAHSGSGSGVASAMSGPGVTRVAHSSDSESGGQADFDIASLRPELITATENVTLRAAHSNGLIRKRLVVRFEDMLPEIPVNTAAESRQVTQPSRGILRDDEGQDRISFETDSLEAIVGISNDPQHRAVEFRNIWLNGDVEIIRQSKKADSSFTASGNLLYATGSQPENLEIKIFGDPARMSSESRNIEGQRIDLTAVHSEARVPGSGRIRFMNDTGFDGRPLPQPTPLDIYWSDHMVFQKRSAKFVGNVRIVMNDEATQEIEVTCDGMTVHFSTDITLGRNEDERKFEAITTDDSETGPIERIECHNTVKVHVEQWKDGEPHGRHSAEFADLDLNLITGDFTAVGRGHLESVSPDSDGQLQGAAPATARANTPSQTTETAFVFLTVEFIGDLTGNLHRREASLTHNVMALVTPVRHIDEETNIDVPASELPERAGILLAEHLTISAIDNGDELPASFAIVARDNARLRLRSLSASGADVITYDHQKQQFIMKAEGDGIVRVNHQDGHGNQLNSLMGKRFEYYRRTNQLSADGLGGLKIAE